MSIPDLSRAEVGGQFRRPIGRSAEWIKTLETAERVARTPARVLLTGESGSGKEVVARYIHARSVRAAGPFVAVNCAGLSESVLESELFGHQNGSLTGATRGQAGTLRQAHEGTLLLDEIAELSLSNQAVLLRLLDGREAHPLRSDVPAAAIDVRVVAATSRDLVTLAADGRFREDLLRSIKVTHLAIPPLRERRDDIPLLVEHALAACGRRMPISGSVMKALKAYHWPGNVRELQNVVEQMAAFAKGPAIESDALPPQIAAPAASSFVPRRERRRRLADDLYDQLVSGCCGFWEDIRPLLLNRDMTRADLRQLIGLGLVASGGTYRGLLDRFGLPQDDYKRLLNFLAAHDCSVDCREFRSVDAARSPRAAEAYGRSRTGLEWQEPSSGDRQTVV